MDKDNNTIKINNEDDIKKELDSIEESVNFTDKDILNTAILLGSLNKKIDKFSNSFEKTEKEFEEFEKDTINEIDSMILEYFENV